MIKRIVKYFCLLLVCLPLSVCSDKNHSNFYENNFPSPSSSIEKNFSVKQDTSEQKENIKQIINLYNQQGLLVGANTYKNIL